MWPAGENIYDYKNIGEKGQIQTAKPANSFTSHKQYPNCLAFM